MGGRDSLPTLHVQEALLPFTCHLPFLCRARSACHQSSARRSLHPQGSWGQGDDSFSWSLGKQSQVVWGTQTQPLQAGWGVASSLPMWRFSSSLPDRKVFFCSMLDALGPAHYCQTVQGSLQVSAALLIEEREEVGTSLLFMCIKTLSGSSPITGVMCNEVSQSSWQGGTSPCLCLPFLPQPWLKLGPWWFWWQRPHLICCLALRWSLGVLLGRPMPSWFLWAPHLQESPHGGWPELGFWWWSWGAFCWGAQGQGDLS